MSKDFIAEGGYFKDSETGEIRSYLGTILKPQGSTIDLSMSLKCLGHQHIKDIDDNIAMHSNAIGWSQPEDDLERIKCVEYRNDLNIIKDSILKDIEKLSEV